MRTSLAGVCGASLLATFSAGAAFPAAAENDALTNQAKALAEIRKTVEFICPTVQQVSSEERWRVQANAEAQTKGLSRTIAKLGVGGSTQGEKGVSRGVPSKDLAAALSNTAQCRYKTLELLQKKMLPGISPAPATGKTLPSTTPSKIPADQKKSNTAQASPSHPPPVEKNGIVIRAFLKEDLTPVDVATLARLLPRFDVRLAPSAIDPSLSADTMFVNRDRVTERQVRDVLSALTKMGLKIKMIEQAHVGGRAEIQIGATGDETNTYEDFPTLDVSELSKLRGAGFWRAAAQSQTNCSRKDPENPRASLSYACEFDDDFRPTGRPLPD